MERLRPLDLEHLTAEQQPVADAILASARKRIAGPFPAWLRHPALASRAMALGDWVRFEAPLPRDLAELVILQVVQRRRCQSEFVAHRGFCLEAGVPEEAVEAIRTGGVPELDDAGQTAALALVREYLDTTRVSDTTYRRALDALGEEQLVAVVAIAGYYQFVATTMDVFEVPLPPGVEAPLA
jgi:4-carboxymuconolactone decarboxylase